MVSFWRTRCSASSNASSSRPSAARSASGSWYQALMNTPIRPRAGSAFQ
jgi:hypothetical protein